MGVNPPKMIVITGASGHLGRCYAAKAADAASCILIDRDQHKLTELVSQLPNPSRHRTYAIDLANDHQRGATIQNILAQNDNIDVLLNCAAYTGDTMQEGWVEPFEDQSINAWRAALEVNLTSCFDLCQKLYPRLKKAEDGNILNIGSIYGELGPDLRLYSGTKMGNPAAYAASKGGISQLTRWLATVLAPDVRVNCVSPGGIIRTQPKRFIEAYEQKVPLKRMATEDDVVGAMLFLTLGSARYITGHNLVVDGGFSIW